LGVSSFASLETFLLVVASSILAGIGFHLFGALFLLGYEP
jgi:outer membrane lipopolysaccharide assembly protein LptE/RlpB